ncbi:MULTISPECIES: hypothetical protein [unclassified Dehalobacter]|uniref:hypothetical protein n=1 Tax=unclassified Dehalobacter TaxID=2635733 RepID=UPI000E6CB711|nr:MULTISPECIES: hypothetical protein [unclassified Dehalobacter]RJE47952.1 hypothetical protein A7K50_00015 [Dehalobacter sp. MCB1]TCX50640.1 hypothetical protein C1I36_08800 [Dehalobacter sp. 14DCB1]TCX52116.1 hypothetical protein C1I38_08910 [Dehalobacter sp. 12DCB1]
MSRDEIIHIFVDLLKKYIFEGVDRYEIADELIKKVDINAIFSSDDFIISDCFYAIKHLTEDKYETSINELKYFLECFEGLREYNLEEKNNIINQK